MNDLQELHLKGQLSEKGYLKETYDHQTDDLKHSLTNLGQMEVTDLLKDKEYRREFMVMIAEEAKKHPEVAKQIVQAAMQKIKEANGK